MTKKGIFLKEEVGYKPIIKTKKTTAKNTTKKSK